MQYILLPPNLKWSQVEHGKAWIAIFCRKTSDRTPIKLGSIWYKTEAAGRYELHVLILFLSLFPFYKSWVHYCKDSPPWMEHIEYQTDLNTNPSLNTHWPCECQQTIHAWSFKRWGLLEEEEFNGSAALRKY